MNALKLLEGKLFQLFAFTFRQRHSSPGHMMRITEAWTPGNPFAEAKNIGLFNKHVGSTAWCCSPTCACRWR